MANFFLSIPCRRYLTRFGPLLLAVLRWLAPYVCLSVCMAGFGSPTFSLVLALSVSLPSFSNAAAAAAIATAAALVAFFASV